MANESYWTYNLPLQWWPADEEDEDGNTNGTRILNYMPRRESCTTLQLEDLLEDGQTREDFLERTALIIENLARLFREAKNNPKMHIYYPDEGMEK